MARTAQKSSGSQISENEILTHLKTRPTMIRRIAKFIANTYGPHLDLSDIATKPLPDQIDCLLTRSLAAHAVSALAGHDPHLASACVVDGGQDLGIDAIAFDDDQKRCWIIQSKFQHSGQGLVSWIEVQKFLGGFNQLLSDSFADANRKILAMGSQINNAAYGAGWKFTVVL